jgi:hypothetical protein
MVGFALFFGPCTLGRTWGTRPGGWTERLTGGLVTSWKRATNGRPPHLAKNERDTRISCTQPHPAFTYAAFIKESRMKLGGLQKLHRKFGGMGHPA